MQVVGHFIGLDADEAGRDAVDGAGDLPGSESAQGREVVARAGVPVFPEAEAAPDVVLPQARLGFVNAQRDGGTERRAVVLGAQSLIVESVAGFVQHAVERLGEAAFIIARGQAAVAGAEAAAEGMRGGVDAPGLVYNLSAD